MILFVLTFNGCESIISNNNYNKKTVDNIRKLPINRSFGTCKKKKKKAALTWSFIRNMNEYFKEKICKYTFFLSIEE